MATVEVNSFREMVNRFAYCVFVCLCLVSLFFTINLISFQSMNSLLCFLGSCWLMLSIRTLGVKYLEFSELDNRALL